MFQHLLVPLDGSPMAEAALPVAAELARRAGARTTLLHVLERTGVSRVHGQRHLATAEEAAQYLHEVASRFFAGLDARVHVHRRRVRRVAESLVRHAAQLAPDLIVLTSHGGVRLRDRVLGNVAQQVTGAQSAPVLMLRPRSGGIPFPFRSLVVPLDGRPEHEQGLVPAAELARLCGAPVLAITIVQTRDTLANGQEIAGALLPRTARELLNLHEDQAADYLRRKVQALLDAGVCASGKVDRGEPWEGILAAIRQARADLVVLATHGKAGSRAFWSGSLAPRLLRRAEGISFLLVPRAEARG